MLIFSKTSHYIIFTIIFYKTDEKGEEDDKEKN